MQDDKGLIPPSEKQILYLFQRYGYSPSSLITKQKFSSILSSDHKRIVGYNINPDLLNQLWDQTQTNSRGQTAIQSITQVIIEAESILQDRIHKLSCDDGMIQKTNRSIIQKRQQLDDYKQYYSDQPAKINNLTKQLIQLELQSKQHAYQLQSFTADRYSLCKFFSPEVMAYTSYSKRGTFYEKKQDKKIQKSKELLFVFHLTWILIIIQMLLSNIRQPFMTLCIYLWSFYIILLQINEKMFGDFIQQENRGGTIGYWIIGAAISIVFDVIFLIIKLGGQIFVMPNLHTSNSIYHWIIVFVLAITIGMRVIMSILYMRLRRKLKDARLYFKIFGYHIFLLEKQSYVGVDTTLNKTQYINS